MEALYQCYCLDGLQYHIRDLRAALIGIAGSFLEELVVGASVVVHLQVEG